MTPARRAITVAPSVASLQTGPGPATPIYVFTLDAGRLYRWAPELTATDDGVTVLQASGGFPGVYLLVRKSDRGADLGAAASQTLTVGAGSWVVIPANTLAANTTIILDATGAGSPTGPQPGDQIEVTRLDTSARTVTFINGGAAAGTLGVMPVSQRAFLCAQFSAGNWVPRRSGIML